MTEAGPSDFRRGPHCDWLATNDTVNLPFGSPSECRRRKGLVTVTDKYGAIATNRYGGPLRFCLDHVEAGTRIANRFADWKRAKLEPTTADRFWQSKLGQVLDLPIDIVGAEGPLGGIPKSQRVAHRWFFWLLIGGPCCLLLLTALAQHFR